MFFGGEMCIYMKKKTVMQCCSLILYFCCCSQMHHVKPFLNKVGHQKKKSLPKIKYFMDYSTFGWAMMFV